MDYTHVCGSTVESKHQDFYSISWKMRHHMISRKKYYNWTSKTFEFSNDLWFLHIFLDDNGWLSLHLLRRFYCESKLSVYFTLGFKAEGVQLNLSKSATHCFTPSSPEFSWTRVVKREELMNQKSQSYPSKYGITVHCQLRLNEACQADAQSRIISHKDNATLALNLSDLYLKQQLCDIRFIVGDRKFQAHASILAARSSVFASMFGHDMKGNIDRVIEIDDCDPDAFYDFLLYLYSAKVNIISEKHAIDLYCIADKYALSQLALWCEQFLLTNLSVEFFCDILVFAMKYKKSMLIKAAEDFFAKHVEHILVTAKWQNYLKENSIAANIFFIKCTQTLKNK